MSRQTAIEIAQRYFDDGGFFDDLARRIAVPSTSQEPDRADALTDYLDREMRASLEALGYDCEIFDNPADAGPILIARRFEDAALPTVLTYGHGDTVRGQDERWRDGIEPWRLVVEGARWYGRGTADNKGQHSVNIGALASVIEARDALGFNSTILLETGEEMGSPGLREFCAGHADGRLAADVFISSDGPRLAPDRPTLFLGARGVKPIDIFVELRDGAHHSGNWGGLLANPAIVLAQALATITDARGTIRVPEWRPPPPSNSVRHALAGLEVDGGEGGPTVDAEWGEPGMTPAERVYAWNSFEILAFTSGTPANPVNAIPGSARAHCHLRYVVGTDVDDIVPALKRHLEGLGFERVRVEQGQTGELRASRLEPDHPWVRWAVASIARTTGAPPAVLPNLGGSLPNDVFADVLGLPTIWVPHSYAGCSQHAPDEHLLAPIAREGLEIMTGLFWDLGAAGPPGAD